MVHDHINHQFGICEGFNQSWIAPTQHEIMNDYNLFNYWTCDTDQLIDGDLYVPFQKTGIAALSFTMVDHGFSKSNWRCQHLFNVPEFQSLQFVRQIAHCQSLDIRSLRESNKHLQTENDNLRMQLAQQEKAMQKAKIKSKVIYLCIFWCIIVVIYSIHFAHGFVCTHK